MVRDKEQITRSLKHKAMELGFSHIGIAKAEALHPESERLNTWLDSGFHAGMAYLSRDVQRRTDPREVVANAASVICVATNYFTSERHTENPDIGKISRYAWGDEYHSHILSKIQELENYLSILCPEAVSKSYVDTGPVMEKAWAVRAGIGWLGKNANVITRDKGSWIFLGVLITSTIFEYDEVISDFCGRCTLCLDACPTQALVHPYIVDSNRCISYLTIELKEHAHPKEEELNFDNWVFGCDVCQDVCPWNSFAVPCRDENFAPRKGNLEPELKQFDEMEERAFKQQYENSPILRAKLRGMQRNARRILNRTKQNELH